MQHLTWVRHLHMWCREQPQTLKKTEEGEREESLWAAAVSSGNVAQCCNLIPGAAAPSPGCTGVGISQHRASSPYTFPGRLAPLS